MKKLLNDPFTYFLLYVAMVPFTFGHAYNNFPNKYKASWTIQDVYVEYGILEKSIGSFMASVAWPFYWSTQSWKKDK